MYEKSQKTFFFFVQKFYHRWYKFCTKNLKKKIFFSYKNFTIDGINFVPKISKKKFLFVQKFYHQWYKFCTKNLKKTNFFSYKNFTIDGINFVRKIPPKNCFFHTKLLFFVQNLYHKWYKFCTQNLKKKFFFCTKFDFSLFQN